MRRSSFASLNVLQLLDGELGWFSCICFDVINAFALVEYITLIQGNF